MKAKREASQGTRPKLFFRIGEVAALVGVAPHVLRYWEDEFGLLRPMKTRGSHRQYRRRDVETARLIHQLVDIEGYTVAGAKRRIVELHGHANPALLAADLSSLRDDLLRAKEMLERWHPTRAHFEFLP